MTTKRSHKKALITFASIEEGIAEGLTPEQMISYETLVMFRKDWQRAKQCGYITDAGLPNHDRLRVNQAGTLLGGFSAGFKVADLNETCTFFVSGESNRYLGSLGLPEFDAVETIAWLMEGVEERVALNSRHRLREREKEPWAWISLRAAKILSQSPEVRPCTWASYSAICVLAGEAGSEEFEATQERIAEIAGITPRSVATALDLLSGLRLVESKPSPPRRTVYRLLSVGKA